MFSTVLDFMLFIYPDTRNSSTAWNREIFTLLTADQLVNKLPCLYRTQEVGIIRFGFLRAVTAKINVIWDATVCSLVDSY